MKPHSILIVNDSAEALDIYKELFENGGYEVYGVSSLEEARKIVQAHEPSVVVIDDNPEGVHGTIIALQLSQEAERRSFVKPNFIAVRGDTFAGEADALACFDHLLTKPTDFEQLDEILRNSVLQWLKHSSDRRPT